MSAIATLAAIGGIASAGGQIANTIGNKIDIHNAPDKLRIAGDVAQNILLDYTKPYLIKRCVDDINFVAETYERTGYLVNIPFSYNFNEHYGLLELVKDNSTRYYFNPIQATFANIAIDSCSVPEGIKSNISERFSNGLRFWNVEQDDVELGNFEYDNVERRYV